MEQARQSSAVYHRHMPDGFMYELRRGGLGWEARRQEGDEWSTHAQIQFAVMAASPFNGTADRDEEFYAAAADWQGEVLR